MIRKLLLPTAAALLLGGCMTGGYNYRSGPGDYYYGEPSVDYRYYGSPYGYGYPGYYSRFYGYGGYYGGRYRYYPRYYYRPRPPLVISPRPDDGGDDRPTPNPDPNPPARPDNDRDAPWRRIDDLRRLKQPPEPRAHRAMPRPRPAAPQIRPRTVSPSPAPARHSGRDSRIERMIRRARQSGESDERRRPR